MDNRIATSIRVIISILLLIGAYGETGIFTTATLGLVLLSGEITAIYLRKISRQIGEFDSDIDFAKQILRNQR